MTTVKQAKDSVRLTSNEKELIQLFRLLPEDAQRDVMEYVSDAVTVFETGEEQERIR